MGKIKAKAERKAGQRNLWNLQYSFSMEDQVRESPSVINAGADDDPTIEDDLSSTVLDLTSYQLHDLDSVDLPQSLTELELTANRLSNLDPRIGNLSLLKKLSLRQNLINDSAVEPISSWHALSALEVSKKNIIYLRDILMYLSL